MKKFTEIFLWPLIKNFIFLSVMIITIFGLFAYIDELKITNETNYGSYQAFIYILQKLPFFGYQTYFYTIFIAVILTISSLKLSNEIIVIRAAGVSVVQILKRISFLSFLLAMCVFIFYETFSINFSNNAEDFKNKSFNSFYKNEKTGFWFKRDNFFISAKKILNNTQFESVKVFEFGQNRLKKIITSNHAEILNNRFEIVNPKIISINSSDKGKFIEVAHNIENSINLDININSEHIKTISINPKRLKVTELFETANFLRDSMLNGKQYYLELYTRLIKPFNLIAILIIILPSIIISSARKENSGRKLFLMLFILIFALVFFEKFMLLVISSFDVSPFLSVIIPSCVLFFLGYLIAKKTNYSYGG